MGQCSISEFPAQEGKTVTIKGWIANRRSSGKVSFFIIRDGSGICQGVVTRQDFGDGYDEVKKLPLESSVIATGIVVQETKAPGGYEMQIQALDIVHKADEFPIGKKAHGPDFLLNHRHLWVRSSRQVAILRVRDALIRNIREYFHINGFTLVDTPIFTTTYGEDSTNLFSVNYFDLGKVYLAQTGQLYLEATLPALGKVFCLGPTFRAELSKTRRHLTEFWMAEAEVAFCDHNENLALQEDFVSYFVQKTIEEKASELKYLERDVGLLKKVTSPFYRISYDEAISLLKKEGSEIQWGSDLGGEDETIITKSFDKPVFIENYPKKTKAFYMKQDPKRPDCVLCADLLAPEGYGEIIGGSQREDSYDVLLATIKDNKLDPDRYKWYLDLRQYGSVPHSGFGLGIERCVAWICGLKHVREAIPFPRMIYRVYP